MADLFIVLSSGSGVVLCRASHWLRSLEVESGSLQIFGVSAPCGAVAGQPRLFAAKVPGAPLMGILFGTAVCWIEGFCRGTEHSVFGYPFGTNGDRCMGLIGV